MVRCLAIQCSATISGFGASLYVRTRPDLLERTRPQFSSTSRCCENDGSAIPTDAKQYVKDYFRSLQP